MGPITVVSERVVLGLNAGSKERSEEENSTPDSMLSRTRLGEKGALHSIGWGELCENEGVDGERREGGSTGPALVR